MAWTFTNAWQGRGSREIEASRTLGAPLPVSGALRWSLQRRDACAVLTRRCRRACKRAQLRKQKGLQLLSTESRHSRKRTHGRAEPSAHFHWLVLGVEPALNPALPGTGGRNGQMEAGSRGRQTGCTAFGDSSRKVGQRRGVAHCAFSSARAMADPHVRSGLPRGLQRAQGPEKELQTRMNFIFHFQNQGNVQCDPCQI